jgi:hypothetical protein
VIAMSVVGNVEVGPAPPPSADSPLQLDIETFSQTARALLEFLAVSDSICDHRHFRLRDVSLMRNKRRLQRCES